jgi:hypothetical protein
MPDDDLATENRRLRSCVHRLEEDLVVLQERLAYAQQQIEALRAELAKHRPGLSVGIQGVNVPTETKP